MPYASQQFSFRVRGILLLLLAHVVVLTEFIIAMNFQAILSLMLVMGIGMTLTLLMIWLGRMLVRALVPIFVGVKLTNFCCFLSEMPCVRFNLFIKRESSIQ